MSVRIMSQVWGSDLADSEMLILLALADWSNDDGECWPSIRQLCAKTRKSERTVQGAIKSMVAAGHMRRDEVPGKGCRYIIHPRSDCTPAKSAPPQRTTQTPAAAADNTSRHTNTSTKATPSPRGARTPKLAWPVPEGVDRQHWIDFLANRKSKRLGLTPSAQRGQLRALAELSDDEWPPGRLVQHAAEHGWGGIHDPRKSENRNGHRAYHDRPSGPLEAVRRSRAERGFIPDSDLDFLPH